MLSEDQIRSLKHQIIRQIEASFPFDKQELAKQQILAMNNDDFEFFLKQNNLLKDIEAPVPKDEIPKEVKKETNEHIFKLIIDGKVKSYKIDENKQALAVLEINPKSLGHIIIIPKQEVKGVENLKSLVFALAKKTAKKLKSKLKANDVQISVINTLGYPIINVIPLYEEGTKLPKEKISENELEELQKKLQTKTQSAKPKTKKSPQEKIKQLEKEIWLPKRIP